MIIDDRVIGKGTYALVKTAYHVPSKLEVAVKVYDKIKMADPRRKVNLKHELESLRSLDHTGIVKLYEYIEDRTSIYLVMEFGGYLNLKEFIKQQPGGGLSIKDVKVLFRQLARGLGFIHSQGIVHRDLKLQNVVLRTIDNPKIVDFGFSRRGLTTTFDDFCGTSSYMSPELLSNKRPRKAVSADVWALGIILYYLLTNEFPFKGTSRLTKVKENPSYSAAFVKEFFQ